jgi:hypothetical protein
MIITFMGERKSGKDYLCDFLVKEHGATRLSFSDEVRYLTVKIFPWMPFDFNPAVKDDPFIHPKNPNNLTPRQIWVDVVGKVRNVVPNYFVEAFEERHKEALESMHDKDKLFVITDFRTPQEWDFLKSHKVPVIKIEREDRTGIPPDAFEQYVRDFNEYNARFVNRLNGTVEFEEFILRFQDRHL